MFSTNYQLRLFLISFCMLLPRISYAEETARLHLIPSQSKINFSIASAMFPIQGVIERFSGKISKFGKAAEQFDLEFECDLASVKFTGEQLEALPIGQILATTKNAKASFSGRPVARILDGRLRMKGELRWRGKVYDVSFPLRMKGQREISLDAEIRGNGDELAKEFPALAVFQIEAAQANVNLRFN